MSLDRRLELAILLAEHEARESFYAFRRYIRPKDKTGWWQKEICAQLQQFAVDFFDGKRPRLVIEAPPQHGKSVIITDFIAWICGKSPDIRTIYASFSERLGVRANLRLQRIFDSQKYQSIFPELKVNGNDNATRSSQFLRNREIIEFCEREGYFRNTTVLGSVTGESLDLGVIDDPIKGRDQAGSAIVRDKTWDWFTDDFFSRFSEDGALLCILTRWHLDDPIGRLREKDKSLKVLSYPAIAIKDEVHRKEGEALFPEHKSIEFLLERKSIMPVSSWLALYQQSPVIVGGELLKGSQFGYYIHLPKIEYRMIYADTAQKTQERNDYSVFECWGKGDDGRIYLLDLIRGKWEAPELERRAVAFWQKHIAETSKSMGYLRQMKVEDKASGTGLIQSLAQKKHIPIAGIQRVRDKYTRLQDVLPMIEGGFVCLPENAPYLSDFVSECEAFTSDDTHMHDDQIDPMIDAIVDMLAGTGFDLSALL